MSQAKVSRHLKTPNSKEPQSTPESLLLSFEPSNLPQWKKRYFIRAKAQFGPLGDALAAGVLPDFDAILTELATTGTYTARKPRPSDRRSTIFGFAPQQVSNLAQVHPQPQPFEPSTHSGAGSDLSGDESTSDSSASDLLRQQQTESQQLGDMLDNASIRSKRSSTSSRRSARRKVDTLSKAEELILSGKIKRVQELETKFLTELPKLCGDMMQHVTEAAASRITQHSRFEATWNANHAIDLMAIFEECALIAPHDTERRIKDIKEARELCYQYDRPLDVFCEEFERFERQLVLLNRPTLPSEHPEILYT